MENKIQQFKTLVSEINISKYNQIEYREIIDLIHDEIFGGQNG